MSFYHYAGDGHIFFIEIGIDDGRGQAAVLRSVSSLGPLEDYARRVRLLGHKEAPPEISAAFWYESKLSSITTANIQE